MSDLETTGSDALQSEPPKKRRRWKRWLLAAVLVYGVLSLVVWGMAEADCSRVVAGQPPLFAHCSGEFADGGSVEYTGPCFSYMICAIHSYADYRPAWGKTDGWAYDDGASVSYGPLFLIMNLFSRSSVRAVPGDVFDQKPFFCLEIESWDRIYFYNPGYQGGPRPKPCAKTEAEKFIAERRQRLLPAALITLGNGLHISGNGREADVDEIKAWLVARGISRGVFMVPRGDHAVMAMEFGTRGWPPRADDDR